MNKKVTFTDAKAGDRVWSITEGWGVIRERRRPPTSYPLYVDFDNGNHKTYTLWGKYNYKDHGPTLFWDEVKTETPEKPLPQLEVDAKVIVWDQDGKKYNRHFSHFDEDGRLFAFNYGHTSFTSESSPEVWVTAWANWELAE